MRQLESIGAKSVGFDYLRAGVDIGLVHAKDRFRLGGIELVKAALRANGFVQQGTHRAIGDQNRVFETFVKIENSQVISTWKFVQRRY
jgi:hypothetical protein